MRKAPLVWLITVVFALALLAGCGKKAEPVDLPPDDTVANIEVTTIEGEKIYPSEGGIEEILDIIGHAEPTRKQSVNDQPTNVIIVYKADIVTE